MNEKLDFKTAKVTIEYKGGEKNNQIEEYNFSEDNRGNLCLIVCGTSPTNDENSNDFIGIHHFQGYKKSLNSILSLLTDLFK